MGKGDKIMRIAGVDIGGTSIKLGIIDESGKFLDSIEYDTESAKGGDYVLETLIKKLEAFDSLDAIGISIAGQVDRKQGRLAAESANIPGTADLQVKARLEKHFNIPVEVENDVNAAGLGEKVFGVGKDMDDFLYITYGTGIGGAIVIDSQLYYGKNGFAAEFGHISSHPGGRKCGCGLVGCYERYASTTALVADAQEIDKQLTNGKVIFEKYHAGDAAVVALVENWIKEISIGLASFIHIFNPATIILGGGVMEQEIIVEKINAKVQEYILPAFNDVEIISATLGNKSGMLGAASLHVTPKA